VRSRGGGGTSRLRGKITFEQVTGPFPIRAGDGGADVLDPPDALEAEGPHGPVHRAAGGAGEAFLAAEQRDPLRPPVQASGVSWTCSVTGWVVQAKSRILSSTRASVTVRAAMRAGLFQAR